MNPYSPPKQLPDGENEFTDDVVAEPREHPLYGVILKMTLWGEGRDKIYRKMEVNGIVGGSADILYEEARRERIRTIRDLHGRNLLVGFGLIFTATAVFCGFWFGLRFIPNPLLYACIIALGVGSWKFINGLAGYTMAPRQEGSVADDY